MGEKSIDDAEHSQRPSYCYTPYIDIELQFDPLQADPLLQKSLVFEDSDDDNGDNHIYHLETDAIFTDIDNNEYLNACGRRRHAVIPGFSMTTASNSLNYQHKRKLPLADLYSDATSDTSGRFDDADESDVMQQEQQPDPPQQQPGQTAVGEEKFEDTTSVHSAKRGRSNGWPFQNEIAYDENGMKIDLSARRSTPTPTPSKGMTERHRASPVLRIRRSRFIEGSMNDRVSEKPPSIYFPDDRNQNNEDVSQSATENKKTLEKRSSGIFRFGKAIASAFHPFGGSKASSKSEQDGVAKSQKEIMKQRQAKAEKAYAELKKSGYRGTNTIANANFKNQVDANIADETWKSIQEKIGYKLPDDTRISQDDTLVGIPGSKDDGLGPMSPEKGVSKLKSFSELRKRTSNLGIPAIRFRDVSPMSMRSSIERDEVDREKHTHQPMERRQSRKELHKQAKLLKRVSNLEDKLERARRELRGYVPGSDNQPTVPTICVDDDHDRQFGPGSLPTLLSERLLEAGYVQGGMQTGRSQRSTKWPPADSLSRKRKSPTPVTAERMHGSNNDLDEEDYDADCGKPSLQEEDDDKSQPESRLRNKLKSARDKRASSLTTKASQRLKAKQSSRNLRAEAKANNVTPKDEGGRHLQEQEGNTSSSSAQKNNRGWTHYGNGYENIPPVPPVPKELLNTTKSVSPEKKKHVSTTMKARIPSKEFAWPEDIF